jgi:hypothetical protein
LPRIRIPICTAIRGLSACRQKPEEGFTWQARYDLASGLKAYWAWATSESGRRYLLGEGREV